jgi:two-component system, NarL family, response regulator NreC
MRGKKTYKIFLADSHNLFRRGLSTLLSAEADIEVVGEAADAETALASAQFLAPDVLTIDLGLIAGDPNTALALRQFAQTTSILLLSTVESAECLDLTVATAARGYMLKSNPPAQLIAGIKRAAIADDRDASGMSRTLPDLQALARNDQSFARTSPLTVREQEVMTLLAEGRTVREVAAELSLSIKTIEAHKLNLMRKLDIHNRATLVEYAVRAGFIPSRPVSVA